MEGQVIERTWRRKSNLELQERERARFKSKTMERHYEAVRDVGVGRWRGRRLSVMQVLSLGDSESRV